MQKILGLLHEGTILDLGVLYRLMVRYKTHFVFAAIFFCSFFSYQFYNEPIIYSVSVPIKVVAAHKVSSDLSNLLPVENTNQVSLEELSISLSSYSFLNDLAKLVQLEPDFKNLNFSNTKLRSSLLGSDLMKVCAGNEACITTKLAQILKDLFFVEQGLTENRFMLIANAREKRTAQILVSVLVKAIDLERIKIRQYAVLKEIQSVGNLISESRLMMQKMGGYEALEEQEKLQNNIIDLKERIRMLQGNISVEISNSAQLNAKVAEYRKTSNRKGASRENYESYIKVQARLNDIKLNLAYLTNISEKNRSPSDQLIISQLLLERSRLVKTIPPGEHLKTMVRNENFKEKQREDSDNFEFEYLVSTNKIKKLEQDYEASKVELNEMMQQKLINEGKVNGMKTDLDFLKSLESKQMSLKLLNATMNSDVIFEDGNRQNDEFRKSSYFKIFLFSFSITFVLYIFSIIFRYFKDDKIYGEEEITTYFKELDFIGDVPLFDS